MKRINLLDLGDDFKTTTIMRTALREAGQSGGADFDEQVRRGRVITLLDELKSSAVYLDLEDADFDKVRAVVKAFRWALADPKLERIIRGIADSEKPPVVAMPNGKGKRTEHESV